MTTRRLCLVTGASAGIGSAFARTYARNGYDVALTARRTDRLETLADEIRLRFGVEALTIAADLAEPGAADKILAEVAEHGRVVDALVNNAGYSLPTTYAKTTWAEQQAFLQVLVMAVAELSHKALPGMLERGFGRIVNVASLMGLLPGTPSHTLYSAAKSFVVSFSESLHLECLNTGVHVSALCPGLTYSEFHDANHTREQFTQAAPAWLWSGADEVAAGGYEAAEANRPICVTGAPNKLAAALVRLMPQEWTLALFASQAGRFGRA